MTIGLLGKKIGMTQVFLENGLVEAVTVVEAGPCVVTQVKTKANDGYEAVQVGFHEVPNLSRPLEGHLRRTGKFKYLQEMPAKDMGEVQVGQKINASMFQPGDRVDVTGTTKGRGLNATGSMAGPRPTASRTGIEPGGPSARAQVLAVYSKANGCLATWVTSG